MRGNSRICSSVFSRQITSTARKSQGEDAHHLEQASRHHQKTHKEGAGLLHLNTDGFRQLGVKVSEVAHHIDAGTGRDRTLQRPEK